MALLLNDNIDKIYDEYSDMLYRIALTHSADTHDAMDAVQDVFVKFMSEKRYFLDREHLKAWLIRATINRCCDLIRKNKIRQYTPLEEVYDLPIEENGLSQNIKEMLDGLSDKYKAVLVLYYLEGFSVEETASILKLSVSAVKMRLSRAREKVSQIHKKEDFYV